MIFDYYVQFLNCVIYNLTLLVQNVYCEMISTVSLVSIKSSSHFLIEVFFFAVVLFHYIFWVLIPYQICDLYFLPFRRLFFILLCSAEAFQFDVVQLVDFSFCYLYFRIRSKTSSPRLRSRRLLPVFSSGSLITFLCLVHFEFVFPAGGLRDLHSQLLVAKSVQLPVGPTDHSPRGSCPRDFHGKNNGVGCHFLLPGIFPPQGLNTYLLCRRHILYH